MSFNFGSIIGNKILPESGSNSGRWGLSSQYYLRSINRWFTNDFSVSPNTSNINEGQTVTFTTTTVGVPNGTTLYYTISGTVTAADFNGGSLSGSFVVNSNTGSVNFTAATEYVTEGTESFVFQLRTGSTSGPIVATSSTVTINDTTLTPTYTITPTTTTVNEGSSVTFDISTTNLPDGTTLYYTLLSTGGTVNSSDFSSGSLTGSITLSGSAASVSYTLASDSTTGEGDETFQLQLRTGSTSGTVVATSPTVTISDTSAITYAVSPSVSTITEGSSVTFNVTTLGVANGTTLYWSITGVSGSIANDDFSSPANAVTNGGSFTINSNAGSVALTAATTSTNEGSESFRLQIRTGSTTGTIVATSSTVTINEPVASITASGAITSDIGGYRYHVFTSPGTFAINSQSEISVDYLVVAGGGSGAATGGGGGAGGFRTGTGFPIVGPTSYPIIVGAGGASHPAGSVGNPSSFSTISSTRGGFSSGSGGSGSGGGSSFTGTPGGPFPGGSGNQGGFTPPEGNPGGAGIWYANTPGTPPAPLGGGWHGGGGGSGGSGGNGSYPTGGSGGSGTYSPLGATVGYGSPTGYFSGGGGGWGGGYNNSLPPTTPPSNVGSGGPGSPVGGGGQGGSATTDSDFSPSGTFYPNPVFRSGGNGAVNSGGGGGGWMYGPGPSPFPQIQRGGSGGSGIVIIRYLWPV